MTRVRFPLAVQIELASSHFHKSVIQPKSIATVEFLISQLLLTLINVSALRKYATVGLGMKKLSLCPVTARWLQASAGHFSRESVQ